MNPCLEQKNHEVDVCVVGGGMAGLVAAVAAARRGARTLLLHDRPVLGGNASSEVRMWICGAHGANNKETGILEEMQLENLARNPSGLYSIWDSVLFQFAAFTPNLTTILNCSCNNLEMQGGRIRTLHAWELPAQTWHHVTATMFIDCSGDSILAPLSGARFRSGRESREEFGEPIAPARADLKTMGNSILMQLEETGRPQEFTPPGWAHRFDKDTLLPSRVGQGFGANFWWIELGGLQNTITDCAAIQQELYRTAWGVLDYLKNRGPQAEKLRNWRLRWLGSLPGKRENRRYEGPHILTQHDVEAGGKFDDIIAYGGWSMDDHHPAGLYYPGKATLFHPAPSPYGIALRCLYSVNIPNLLFAGRNISATHCALSSTRVMGTCAILGQAAGTAAALCAAEGITPDGIRDGKLRLLQEQLMEDDCWLPGKARAITDATRAAALNGPGETAPLRDGHDRPIDGDAHSWTGASGSVIEMRWPEKRRIAGLRVVTDSNLADTKRLPCAYEKDKKDAAPPAVLLKEFRVEAEASPGRWETVFEESGNIHRLVYAPVERETTAVRLVPVSAWGGGDIRLFSLDAYDDRLPPRATPPPIGSYWTDLVNALPSADTAPPDNGLEDESRGSGRFGA